MRRWWWIPVLVVAVSACASDGSDQGSSPDGSNVASVVIESSDGLATLALPEGALPEGIAPDDLQLHAVAIESIEDGVPMMRVQLLPHGLRLNEPALLTIELPLDSEGGFLAIHQSGGSVEFLDGGVRLDGDAPRFATEIDHFSDVYLGRGVFVNDGLATGSMVLAPNPVSPGQVQEAHVGITVSETVSILLLGDDGVVRLYEFLLKPAYAEESTTDWSPDSELSADWDPPRRTPEAVDAADGWETVASSKCLQPNTTQVYSETTVNLQVTVLDISQVTDAYFAQIAEVFGGLEDGYSVPSVSDEFDPMNESPAVEELEIGNELDATSWAISSSEAICTEVSTAQVPPGLDPRAHVVSVEPVVTADGTQGFIVTYSQPWTGLPDLFSFFVELNFTAGECSMTAAVETHDGTVNASGPWWLLDDGSSFVDTGCDINPGAPIDINGRSGSWEDESTTQPVFADFVFRIDPDAVAIASGPFDMGRVVDNLGVAPIPLDLDGFQITGASNDGSGKITVDFKGPVKDLVEGDAYIVAIRVEA